MLLPPEPMIPQSGFPLHVLYTCYHEAGEGFLFILDNIEFYRVYQS